MPEGSFIAFEGLDGSGITTQARRTQENLEKRFHLTKVEENGPSTHLTKEPTDGPAGGPLRLALSERLELDTEALALLFAADRKDHVEQEIRPLLEKGYIVLADRYYLSSYAYQLDGVSGDLDWLRQINSKSLTPDLTILIDVPAEECAKRINRDRLTVELYEDVETLKNIRENYKKTAEKLKSEGENIIIIDGDQPRDVVEKEIMQCVFELLQRIDTI